MHILLLHQAFAALGEPGGTRHHEMARYLTEGGHRVTVLAGGVRYLTGEATQRSRWLDKDRDDRGVRIWRPYTYHGWHKSFVHRVFSFLSFMVSSFLAGLGVRGVDVVWGTSPPLFQAVSAWLLARLKGVPFVLEVRDLWPLFAIEVGVLRSDLLISLSRWLERFLYRRADWIVVNSPGFIEHVSARGGERVELIPNGVDVSMFDPGSSGKAFRDEHDLDSAFVVLYAGAHGMSNDLGVVLEAASQVAAPEVLFVLLGAGKEKEYLQAESRRLGLTNLRFVDPVPKQRMPAALAAADVCLAILKPIDAYKTTYPNKVFDYMAAGRPVVLVIDGVIRQVVEEAGAGVFVPPGDPAALAAAVEQLRSQPDKAREMGRRGRRYVAEHFDRNEWAQRLAVVFERVVAEEAAER
ncbi:MAG: glycosyltransferase family 4 protein [Anaerolineales bacterium]